MWIIWYLYIVNDADILRANPVSIEPRWKRLIQSDDIVRNVNYQLMNELIN